MQAVVKYRMVTLIAGPKSAPENKHYAHDEFDTLEAAVEAMLLQNASGSPFLWSVEPQITGVTP